jgi:hypothetical protein
MNRPVHGLFLVRNAARIEQDAADRRVKDLAADADLDFPFQHQDHFVESNMGVLAHFPVGREMKLRDELDLKRLGQEAGHVPAS